jgi:adenosylcobinamide-GDP ribazoletransferase
MALYFPLVGILIGGLLCGFDFFCSHFAGGETLAILDVLFLALVSGGIHLDGLADAADGLLAHRPKEKTLEIMRDPRIGAMGALALIFCILIKYSAIRELEDGSRWIWLMAAPAFARTAQAAGLVLMNYARKNGGIGDNLFQKNKLRLLLFTPLPALIPFSQGALVGMEALFVFILVTGIFFLFCRKKIGGMTGDTLGALSEIMEACLLVLGGI